MLSRLKGTYYTEHVLPLQASSANTAIEAVISNPLGRNAKIVSIDHLPVEAITGDNSNSQHMNILLADGSTEIANLDYDLATDAVRGVAKAFTLSGTAAQLTIAAGICILYQREEIGTQPARIAGHKIRVGWKGI